MSDRRILEELAVLRALHMLSLLEDSPIDEDDHDPLVPTFAGNGQLPPGPQSPILGQLSKEELVYWQYLLNFVGHPFEYHRNFEAPIFRAIFHRDIVTFRQLLSDDNLEICDDTRAMTPLALTSMMSCSRGPDSYSRSAVPLSVFADHLIKRGANVNCRFAGVSIRFLTNITPIAAAVNGGDVGLVELLLKNGADLSVEVLPMKHTPLFYAIINENPRIFDWLLRFGANINHRDVDGNNVLIVACAAASEVIVKIILNQNHGEKIDLHAKNNRKCTALHAAVFGGSCEIVELLLNRGADFNACTVEGHTPLDLAIVLGTEDIERILKQNGGTSNLCRDKIAREPRAFRITRYGNTTPLHIAAIDNSVEDMKYFLKRSNGVDERDMCGRTALHKAAMANAVEAAEFLLSHGAEINASTPDGYTPLRDAVSRGSEDVVKLLLRNGANIADDSTVETITGMSLLHSACQIVLKRNRPGFPADLVWNKSEEKAKTRIVKLLISNYAPFDVMNSFKDRPYDVARRMTQAGFSREIEEILELQNNLFTCILRGDLEEIRSSVRKGAIVNCRSIKYKTPLQYAVSKGRVDVVDLLIQLGADVNYALPNGATALHYAAEFHQPQITLRLLLSGANFRATTVKAGKTPLDFCDEATRSGEATSRLLRFVQSAFSVAEIGLATSAELLSLIGSARNSEGQTLSKLYREANKGKLK